MEIAYYEDKDYTNFYDEIGITTNTYIKFKVSRHNSRNIILNSVDVQICINNKKFCIIDNADTFFKITNNQLKEKIILFLKKLKDVEYTEYDINYIIKKFETFRNTVITKNITDCDDYVPNVFFDASIYGNDDKRAKDIIEKITNDMPEKYVDYFDFSVISSEDICISDRIKIYLKLSIHDGFDKKGMRLKNYGDIRLFIMNNYNIFISFGFVNKINYYLNMDGNDFISNMKKRKTSHNNNKWYQELLSNTKAQDILKKTFIKIREEYLEICAIASKEIKKQNIFHTGA